MAVELFMAALALLLWLQIEDGLLRSMLFNIVILGSISTLFFNGNPLLRFDGYHILCDLLDSPNLASRANKQLTYSLQYYGYGVQGLHSPASSKREACWLIFYAIAAFAYRIFVPRHNYFYRRRLLSHSGYGSGVVATPVSTGAATGPKTHLPGD